MRTRIFMLSLLFLAGACASANPRPEQTTPTPASPPPSSRPVTAMPSAPPPSRPVSSDPGVRTLQQPALGGLIAETEPDAPTPRAAPGPAPSPRAAAAPEADADGLGAPPAGALPPLPDAR